MRSEIMIKWNRPVNYDEDYISLGGFEIELNNGTVKRFDFTDSAQGTANDRSITCAELENLDETYEDGDNLTINDIKNIKEFKEIFIGISKKNEQDDTREPLEVKTILSMFFEEYDENSNNFICYDIPDEILADAVIEIDHNI